LISTLHDSCLQAQEEAKQKLGDWINGIDEDVDDIEILGTWVKNPLSIRGRDPEDFLPNYIHPKDLDLTFLSKINLKNTAPNLALVQENTVLKERNRELEQKLQEQDQKLLRIEAEMEQARIREEKNRSEMNQRYADIQETLKQILESQSKPLVAHL
jgi:nicotinamide riboside kinase